MHDRVNSIEEVLKAKPELREAAKLDIDKLKMFNIVVPDEYEEETEPFETDEDHNSNLGFDKDLNEPLIHN